MARRRSYIISARLIKLSGHEFLSPKKLEAIRYMDEWSGTVAVLFSLPPHPCVRYMSSPMCHLQKTGLSLWGAREYIVHEQCL